MTNWARIIAQGWPGARFHSHAFIEPQALTNALDAETAQAVFDAACAAVEQVKLPEGFMILGNAVVQWADENTPMPSREDILSRKDDLLAELDALAEARLKAKAFAQAYPPEKLVELLSDETKRQEVIDAAAAAKAAR